MSESEKKINNPLLLLISTQFDPHVDFIVEQLTRTHIPFVRFNTEDFPLRATMSIKFSDGDNASHLIVPNNAPFKGEDITGIWYRRPAPPDLPHNYSPASRQFAEQEIQDFTRGLWEMIQATWVNHPEFNRRANIKLRQLQLAQQLGFTVPDSLVTNDPAQVRNFFKQYNGNVIIKPLSRGLFDDEQEPKGIYTSIVSEKEIKHADRVQFTPVLLQENISKNVELRITVVGNDIFTAAIHSQLNPRTRTDWRKEGAVLKHTIHKLPPEIQAKCLQLTRQLNLNFGAIDMIVKPDGSYVFLEINPNGQWAWIEEMTGMPISSALINLLVHGL